MSEEDKRDEAIEEYIEKIKNSESDVDINNYLEKIFIKLEREVAPKPKIIWHYTSLCNFYKIFSKDKKAQGLYMFSANKTNDPKEGKKFLDRVNIILDKLNISLDKYYFDNRHAHIGSFTRFEESLNQWRSYGKNAEGIAIGFNYEKLKRLCDDNGWLLAPCIYADEKVNYLIKIFIKYIQRHYNIYSNRISPDIGVDDLINDNNEDFKEDIKVILDNLEIDKKYFNFDAECIFTEFLCFFRFIVKANAYYSEFEYRIIINPETKKDDMLFLEGVPKKGYFKLPISINEREDEILIEEISIGSNCCENDHNKIKEHIENFYTSKVDIYISQIKMSKKVTD